VRVAPAVSLSPEERATLERWSRGRSPNDFRILRARILLDAAAGLEDIEIAERRDIHRLTAARWRARFLASRLRGLERDRARSPRPGTISDEQIRAIVRAGGGRPFGRTGLWSTRSAARRFGVSHSTVRRVWDAYGVVPRSFGGRSNRPDPALRRDPLDVVGVYLRPPDYAVAFTVGTAPGKTLGRGPAPAARGEGAELAPGFDRWIERDAGIGGRATPTRRRQFLHFLGEVHAEFGSDREIRLLVAGPDLSGSPRFSAWRTRHPRFEFEEVEGVERWRDRLGREIRTTGGGRGGGYGLGVRGELVRRLADYLTNFHEGSGGFEWVASAGDVARRRAGFRLRYDLSVTGHAGFKGPSEVVQTVGEPRSPDPRARPMARTVLRRSLRVARGERVAIESWTETLEFANAFVLEALRIGARPILLYQDEPTYWAAATEVPAANLAKLGDHARAALERSDALVSFFGPSDRERFHSLPRPTMLRLSEYRDALYAAAAEAKARAVQIALGRASPASARMYGVELAPWRDELIEGTLVNPNELHRRATTVVRRLCRGRELRVHHPNGTELHLRLRGKPPEVSDGLVRRAPKRGGWNLVQLPAGVVSVDLDQRVADGTFQANVPTAVGVSVAVGEVAGGRWRFENGRLRHARYERGQELFEQSYGTAGPARDRPGTLSIGLNPRIDRAPLLEDQGLGTITLQIGYGPEAWRGPRSAWRGWLLLRGGDLDVDETPVVRGGVVVP